MQEEDTHDAEPIGGLIAQLVALALFGAAAIHLVVAPEHFQEDWQHGLFMLLSAWLQIGLGVAFALGSRRRVLVLGAACANAALLALWFVSRTIGIQGEIEPIGFVDALCIALEVVAISGAIALATRKVLQLRVTARSSRALLATCVLAVTALLSASMLPAVAGEGHAHNEAEAAGHAHGHVHDGGDDGSSAVETHQHTTTTTMDMHPDDTTTTTTMNMHHGGQTTTTTMQMPQNGGESAGGGMGMNEWEQIRRRALEGGLDAGSIAARQSVMAKYLTQQIVSRSGTLAMLPSAERDARVAAFVKFTMDHYLENEHGNHTMGPDEWTPLDPATEKQLQTQLQASASVAAQFPTAKDAIAAGYFQVTPWAPGIGAHYLNTSYVSSFDPAHPSILLYNGNGPDSKLVGVSYAVTGSHAPAGFAGPNDHWHEHPELCMVGGFVVGGDNTPAGLCSSIGGAKGNGLGPGQHLWMMHLWQVPGWESGWGLFSAENPSVNLATWDGN